MNKEEHSQEALAKIRSLYGTPTGEDNVTLFVDHHLAEIEPDYFSKTYGTTSPTAQQILDSLVLIDTWSSEDDGNIDVFDFSLPGNVTNYLISVRFAGDAIQEISMES
ncbi:hypothetical protein [Profundibacter sp.]